MKNNADLQKDVQNAIRWEPSMHAAEIGVTSKDGVVTLSGTVDSYSKKLSAERATKNVVGVRAVVEEIEVSYGANSTKNDTEIATDIFNTLENNWEVPNETIKVKVEDGWVNLSGDVAWKYQEEAAKDAIKTLIGIKGISSLIKVKSLSKDILEKADVEKSFSRNWAINSDDVKVEVAQNKVKLTGSVHSLYQKEEAGRLAWNTPGVSSVENELAVIYK